MGHLRDISEKQSSFSKSCYILNFSFYANKIIWQTYLNYCKKIFDFRYAALIFFLVQGNDVII